MDFEGKMTKEQTIEEFRNTGLLMFINQILHIFGWAIGVDIDENGNQRLVPLRTKFRGFSEESISRNYEKLARWIRDNSTDLYDEAEYKKEV